MADHGARLRVYLETAPRRTFASAVDWPGWSRGGKTEEAAITALVQYAPRYAAALAHAQVGARLEVPPAGFRVEVTDRLPGNVGTVFGVPTLPAPTDAAPVDELERDRLVAILIAAWRAFDRAAESAGELLLRKGPRGGGREAPAIVEHVREAEAAYLLRIGGTARGLGGSPDPMAEVRHRALEALRSHLGSTGSDQGAGWSPRYFARRSAWHALDHAWEIEDRLTG